MRIHRYYVKITFSIDEDHLQKLDQLSQLLNRNRSELIRFLVDEELKRQENNKPAQSDPGQDLGW